MEKWLETYPLSTFIIGLILTIMVGFIAYWFARLLLSNVSNAAGVRPPLVTAMTLLGILGVIGLIGALFTSQESAYTIAATVVGGLTGYLTAQAQQNRIDETPDEGYSEPDVVEEEEPVAEPGDDEDV